MNFIDIKMHGTTIKKIGLRVYTSSLNISLIILWKIRII